MNEYLFQWVIQEKFEMEIGWSNKSSWLATDSERGYNTLPESTWWGCSGSVEETACELLFVDGNIPRTISKLYFHCTNTRTDSRRKWQGNPCLAFFLCVLFVLQFLFWSLSVCFLAMNDAVFRYCNCRFHHNNIRIFLVLTRKGVLFIPIVFILFIPRKKYILCINPTTTFIATRQHPWNHQRWTGAVQCQQQEEKGSKYLRFQRGIRVIFTTHSE